MAKWLGPAASVLIVVGCAPDGRGIDAAAIDRVFAEYASDTTPGCAVGVYRDGQIAYAKGYGMADLERNIPISPAMIFDLGSTSKQFAAAAVILLANEGKLSLGDDVRKYVPEVPDFGTPVTIDHMLRHTSGLRDYNGLLYAHGYRFEDATGDEEALDIIARQRALNFAPGSRWDYSNTGFFLLSTIVKRVTGQNLAEFARERIFGPLGMAETHFRNDHTAILPGRALAYSPRAGGGFQIDLSNWDQLGDGAVYSSVEELIKWDEDYYRRTVGGQALVDKLTEPGTLNDGRKHSYGRGLFIDSYRGLARIHHGGAWAGYRAMLMRFPAQHTSVALTCNVGSANTNRLAERVADVVLADHLAADSAGSAAAGPAAALPADADRLVGMYYSAVEQRVIRVIRDTAGLSFATSSFSAPMTPRGPNEFDVGGFLTLRFADGAPAPSVRSVRSGEESPPLDRVEAGSPTRAEWDGLVGRYYSPELDATWVIERSGDTVLVRNRSMGRMQLSPAMTGAFQAEAGLLQFLGAPARRSGFLLHSGRMLGLRFERVP